MNINMKYYNDKEDILSEEENKVIENGQKNVSFEEIFENEPTVNNYIHLSNVKENLLNWYEFKDNCSILEIGANFGELTSLLIKRASNVVAIESSLKKAKFLEEKFKENSDNLEVIVGDFKDITLDTKFDYIVITDYLEENNFFETLDKAKEFLEVNGTFLIAVDNKYGVKNWKGKDDYKALLNNKSNFTKKCIENDLNKLGMNKYKFYYIYPEYKAPNLFYTDDYEISIEDLSRNFELNEQYEATGFKENEVLENLIRDEKELINFFANSFLIEISNYIENDIKYITFSNYRKKNKQIQTIITTEKVIKKPVNEEAETHIKEMINNMRYFPKKNCVLLDKRRDEISVESDFINGKKLDEIIINSNNIKEEFDKYKEFLYKSNRIIQYSEINKEELLEPLKDLDEEVLKKFNFVEYGFVDMIPKNCFVIGGVNFFFDQEWMLKNIPLEFILYRAIKNTYSIDCDELCKQYDLDKNEEVFKKLEEYFEESIMDKKIILNILLKPSISKKEIIEVLKNEIDLKENHISNLEAQKEELISSIQEKDVQLSTISDSISWKITKPLRWISKWFGKLFNKGDN